ncbi:MAG TPA: hypothetical protein DC000_07300 [Clostridiales bacterium]|nr:hypothetical protein [Clostridiales bacterium]
MIEEKLTIEMLTENGVSILKQNFQDNKQLGENHRVGYENNVDGREKIKNLPQSTQNAILAIWGATPTVTENTVI